MSRTMDRKAIILAAGMGTRLKPLTLQNHKCLTEVNGIPILENALGILERNNFKEVVIVVGYLKEQIKQKAGDHFGGMLITYAENDAYEDTNTSCSLKLGLDRIDHCDELVVLEGDVFFENQILINLLSVVEQNATVLEPYNADLDGTFAELGPDHYIVDWTHKSQRPEYYTLEDKYKTVNIHKFGQGFLRTVLRSHLLDSVERCAGKEPLESVMMRIVRANPKMIRGMVLHGQKWFEIDDTDDLKKAEHLFRDYSGLE